jgi:hypothetical protein
MYYLLTWTVDEGANPAAVIEAELRQRMAALQPQCEIVPGHAVIYETAGDDAEYEDILADLTHIREAYDRQLRFALLRSNERYLDGEGYDKAAAWSIID